MRRSRVLLGAVLCLLVAGLLVGAGALPASAGANPTCDADYTGTAGDDVIFGDGGDNHICGRAGNDKIFGGDGHDILDGQDGNDQLFGGYGSDILNGGRGRDRLVPAMPRGGPTGPDSNDLNGGPGHDTADYSNQFGLEGSLNLGFIAHSTGVDDLIFGGGRSTVENVQGTPGDDYMEGDVGANEFWGGFGDDEFEGRGGEDRLYGQGGDDVLFGQGGNDFLNGGDQSTDGDFCFGGAGNNTIVNCFP